MKKLTIKQNNIIVWILVIGFIVSNIFVLTMNLFSFKILTMIAACLIVIYAVIKKYVTEEEEDEA